jgi:hypothetical protein
MNWKWLAALGATSLGAASLHKPETQADLQKMAARFIPTEIGTDLSRLPGSERAALAKLIQAAKLIDALFLRQVWSGNESVLLDLSKDTSPLGRARLHYFLINKGPWSALDGNAPFLPGVPPKPRPANFYPSGASQEAMEKWIQSLDEPQRRLATGFFTVIRWSPDGARTFQVVPYSQEYQPELAEVASLLTEAASLTVDPTLRAFLNKRAAAFGSNDYYDSDLAWMELASAIEPTLGPYEVYQDEWFNAKAAFEAFIAVRDETETAKLAKFGGELQEIEDHLPIDAELRNPKLGAMAPIRVVNLIFGAGDGNHGVQTAAYNLPNDERITKDKGAKRVMLKNVQEAKFKAVLVPISKVALAPADQNRVTFDAFFTHILMHELMHGLGPHVITAGGRASTVRQELKDSYSAVEEAKADISGLFALQYLIDKGALPKSMETTIYTTFLASCFRSLRFGLTEAHAKGIALQLNYLLDAGAFGTSPDGTFFVNTSKIKAGVAGLTRELMTLQAQGNRAKAMQMLTSLSMIRAPVKKVLDRLSHVPVDIEPRFKTAEALLEAQSGPSSAR